LNLYFKPAQIADIKAAFDVMMGDTNTSPKTYYERTIESLSEIRDAFKGGRRALRFLERKPGESADQWSARQRLFQNVPLIKHIIGSRADMAYGTAPAREFTVIDEAPVIDEYGNKSFPKSEELDEWFENLYEYSAHESLMRKMVIPAAFRDMQSTIKLVECDGEEQPYRLCYLPKHNVCYVMDPEDSFACLGVIECRKLGKAFRCTLWTLDSVVEIDDNWQPVGAIEDNPVPGTIPYVPFSPFAMPEDFGSPLEDAILDQKHLINVRSQFSLGFRSQTFSQLFTTGTLKGQTYTGADGKERTYFSPEAVIEAEQGATAQFLNPAFPLTEASELEKSWLKQTLESHGISSFTVDPSGAPEQPMALLIKMFRPLAIRREDIASFQSSEEQLARVLIAYARTDGWIAYDADQIDFCAEFPKTILPMDQQREREQDLAAVVAGLMLREDYIAKWIMETDANAGDIREYIDKLDAEQAKMGQAKAAVASSLISSRSGTGVASALISRLDQGKAVTAQPGPPVTYASGAGPTGGATATAPSSGGGGGTAGGGGGSGGRVFTDGGAG
jgi:hypothetical protein